MNDTQLGGLDSAAVRQTLLDAAEVAAAITLPGFRTNLTVDNKLTGKSDRLQGTFDPVTEADREAELAIRALIGGRFPDHGIVGEEWDDKIAGEQFRRVQARELIRSVKWIYKPADEDSDEESVRAFHAIRDEEGYAYDPVEEIIEDPLRTKMLLADMEREWQTLKRRYAQFEEFWRLVRGDADEAAA